MNVLNNKAKLRHSSVKKGQNSLINKSATNPDLNFETGTGSGVTN